MLVVDMEASGLIPEKNSIVSLGAVDFYRPERMFYEECRIWDGADIWDESLAVNGFSRGEVTDPKKQSLEDLITAFFHWAEQSEDRTLAGQNVSLDRDFINVSLQKAKIDYQFGHRSVDLQSVAYADHLKRGIPVPIKKNHTALNLDGILQYVGMPEEPHPHNGLTGAKVEAEAFSRLIYGKNLLEEYAQYPIPEFLKQ